MERGSSKHGQQLDAEPSGEDQPEANEILDYAGEPVRSGLAPADVDARAEIAKHLRPSAFPSTAETLLDSARGEEAPGWIIDELARLPADIKFDNVQDVWITLGHRGEQGRA